MAHLLELVDTDAVRPIRIDLVVDLPGLRLPVPCRSRTSCMPLRTEGLLVGDPREVPTCCSEDLSKLCLVQLVIRTTGVEIVQIPAVKDRGGG